MQVRQAANVLELVEYFARRKRPASLAEIADDLGWPRSSTFNLVGTLADRGYLYEPQARGGFYPSPRWLAVAQAVCEAEPLSEAVLSLTTEVAEETGETTAIGALAGASVILLHVVESTRPIRYFAQIGDRVPIQASSLGRALLAQFTPEERQTLYRRVKFERFSETTPTSIEEVEAELRRSAERGYHQSLAEFVPDLAGVAMPLPFNSRRLSIVTAGPVYRCLEQRAKIAETITRAIHRFA